jgi:TetR/AcrR family transcriptional regulator, cholesterol catabolism regulator
MRKGADGNRRAQIRDAAARDFARNGVLATTVRDIAREAGILSGSLYYYFDSKETIVDEILSEFVLQLVDTDKRIVAESPTATVAIERLVRAVIESVETHPYAIRILQNDAEYLSHFPRFSYLDTTEREIRDVWVRVLETGVSDGSVRSDLPPDIVYRFIRDSVTMLPRWYEPGGELGISEIADMWIAIIIRGIQPHNESVLPARRHGAKRE